MSRHRGVALAAVALLAVSPFALAAQDGWSLPVERSRTIRVGETKNSSLDSGDRKLEDGSFYEAWFFEGRAGQQVTITMRAGGFDAFLALGRHNGDVVETNDDYEPDNSTNAQISIALPTDGMYMIRANSLGSGETGDYTLSLGGADGAPASGGGKASSGSTMSTAEVFGMPVNRSRMLQSGQQVSAALDASDNKLDDDSYFEVYYVDLTAGQQLTVTMRSGAFDTFLSVAPQGATETAESNDDIEEGNTDSRVEFTAPSAGTYVIIANSLESGETGDFTLVATFSGGESVGGLAGEMIAGGKGGAPRAGRALTLGQTINSELSAEDDKLGDNSFYELWLFQGEPGSRVTITMRSGDFDAFLTIRDIAAESIGSDDDSGGNTDAQVTITIPDNGRIAIVANSLGEGETGRYTLQIARAP